MSAGLALLAAAALCWPGRRPLDRARLGADRAVDRRGQVAGVVRRLPVPLLAGGLASLAAAVLTTPLVAVLSGICAWLAARGWIARRRDAGEAAEVAALAEALGALGAELRSGRSVTAATSAAVAACADERCGRALALAVRAPDAPRAGAGAFGEALARISAAVVLSGRTGCSLAVVLSAVEDDLRARGRHALELRSATAGPRASALLLAGLPLLGLAMGAGVGADPWHELTATGPGQLLLVVGVGLEIAGIAWSGRLVRRAVR
ncbi:MAG: type II secretion system F family protein [Blastococcus sp.]